MSMGKGFGNDWVKVVFCRDDRRLRRRASMSGDEQSPGVHKMFFLLEKVFQLLIKYQNCH